MDITTNEILAEITKLMQQSPASDGAVTTTEMTASLGRSLPVVKGYVKKLIAAGVLEPVKVKRITMTGGLVTTWGYALAKRTVTA
jgi:Mn-dependent DtxR family transcriptional regulator